MKGLKKKKNLTEKCKRIKSFVFEKSYIWPPPITAGICTIIIKLMQVGEQGSYAQRKADTTIKIWNSVSNVQ